MHMFTIMVLAVFFLFKNFSYRQNYMHTVTNSVSSKKTKKIRPEIIRQLKLWFPMKAVPLFYWRKVMVGEVTKAVSDQIFLLYTV